MLDHVFTQLVTSHRHAFEAALLQRQAVEERFQVDVFLGDVSFETSYSLPGEERPARIRVDTSLDWPTWSQTAYRSWAIGEEPDELPEVLVEIAFRVQGLDGVPEVGPLLDVLPAEPRGPGRRAPGPGGGHHRAGARPTSHDGTGVRHRGLLRGIVPAGRGHPRAPDRPSTTALAPLGRSVASVLVRIGDLPFTFRPQARRRPPDLTGGRPGSDAAQPNRPASTARARRSAWGRAPTWEMTSAAHTPPSRAALLGGQPVGDPVEEAGGEEVAGTGGVDHPVDRRGRHRDRARRR